MIVVLGSGFHSKSAHSLRSGIMDVRAMLQNGMKKIALGTGTLNAAKARNLPVIL